MWLPFKWMQDGWHGLSSVIAALDPAIHRLCKTLVRSGWPPNSGLPEFGFRSCASRINPTCVVKPAGDGQTMGKRWANANGKRFREAPNITLVG